MTIRSRRALLAAYIPILLGHLDTGAAQPGPAPPPAPPSYVARKPPGPDTASTLPLQLRTICGPEAYYTLVPAAAAAPARFTLRADGGLQVNARIDVPLSLSFARFDGEAIARIEEVSAARPRVWCAVVRADVRYSFPEKPADVVASPGNPSPDEGTLLRVQLYTAPPAQPTAEQPSNPPLAARRAVVLQIAQLAERRAVHSSVDIDQFLRRWTGAQPDIRNNGVLPSLANQSDHILGKLKQESDKWACSRNDRENQGPMAPVVCDEIGKVSATLQEIKTTLVQMMGLSGKEPEGEIHRRYYEKLPALVALLGWEPAANAAEAQQQQCVTLAKLRWLSDNSMYRLTARAIVPVVSASQLATVRYEGTSAQSGAILRQPWGMVVTGVPVGTKISFSSQQGKPISVDPAAALSTLFKYAVAGIPTILPGSKKNIYNLLATKSHPPTPADDTPTKLDSMHANDIPSGLCIPKDDILQITENVKILNSADPKYDTLKSVKSLDTKINELWSTSRVWLVVDPDLAPTAGVEAVSGVYVPFDGEHVVDLVACAAASCAGAEDDKIVRGRVSLTPDRTGTWTMLVEASLGFGVWRMGREWPFTHAPFAIQSSPGFEPINRGDGQDQLFEMNLRTNPRNAISTGVMLGRYFRDRWLLALGPTLTVGGSSGVFSQWNGRVAYRWGDRGTYVTFGPSVRFLSHPEDFALHDRVSVPRPASGAAAEAPRFRMTTGAELQFDVGLAIDIGTLGAAASDVLKTFGGGK